MKNPRCSQCERAVPQSIFRCKMFTSETIVDGEIGSCDAFRHIEPEQTKEEKLIDQLMRDLDKMRNSRDEIQQLQIKAVREREAAKTRIVELEAMLDEADCTQREGGDTRHCDVGAPCWRCIAEKAEKRVEELERERKFTMYWDISDAGLVIQLKNAEIAFDECNSDDPMVQRLRDHLSDTIDNFKQALRQRDLARQELEELKERLEKTTPLSLSSGDSES